MAVELLKLLRKISSESGDRLAYVSDSGTLTYRELSEKSERLAAFIQGRLGSSRSPLVVYGHKSPLMLICFLACIKSGHAYCPIDKSFPLPRVESIVQAVNPPLILSTEELSLDNGNILGYSDILDIIQTAGDSAVITKPVEGNDVLYIIFTSGSTGTPKGVQITADCLLNFIRWGLTLGGTPEEKEGKIFLNQAPFSFDLSVMDLYLCLASGGTLWTLSKEVQADYSRLFSSLRQSNVQIWVSTPSFADMCLSDAGFCETLLPELKLFLFCGETLTNKTVSKLHERFPSARVINTYGPTESTVAVSSVEITPELNEEVSPLPVGVAKPGTEILIMDEDKRPLPEGEKGEIVIVGDTVSIGYFKNPSQTEKAFFSYKDAQNERRAYRTGDEGYLKEGQLFYCGRIDLQVKLHGYRIEIEAIENNLLRVSTVKQAVVLPRMEEGKVKSLCAYIVPVHPVEKTFQAAQQIRTELKKYLPDYMIPKKFQFVDAIPMTNNGKADRKRLGGMNA